MNKQEAVKALENFRKATFDLCDALMRCDDMDFSEGYPFPLSFEEMIFEIANWVDTQTEILSERSE